MFFFRQTLGLLGSSPGLHDLEMQRDQPGGEVLPSYFLYSYAQRMEVHESLYLADVDITLMELVDLHRRMAVPEYVSLCLD